MKQIIVLLATVILGVSLGAVVLGFKGTADGMASAAKGDIQALTTSMSGINN